MPESGSALSMGVAVMKRWNDFKPCFFSLRNYVRFLAVTVKRTVVSCEHHSCGVCHTCPGFKVLLTFLPLRLKSKVTYTQYILYNKYLSTNHTLRQHFTHYTRTSAQTHIKLVVHNFGALNRDKKIKIITVLLLV